MKNKVYAKAGVDIERGYSFVKEIKKLKTKKIKGEFDNNIGLFGGLFDLTKYNIKQPILVASTDGVGTKLVIAIESKNYSGLGQDLVAMSVNDIICQKAKPLFFLDYIATHKIDLTFLKPIMKGMIQSLNDIECSLLGGETAEMNSLYKKNDFDLAGMCVGVMEKKDLQSPKIVEGDVVIGIESSGFHSNGYSLVRKIVKDSKLDYSKKYKELNNQKLSDVLLKPTHIYVNEILGLVSKVKTKGLINVTGGGFYENFERVLDKNHNIVIDSKSWTPQAVFKFFQEKGKISKEEMYSTFNMGIGFGIVCSLKDQKKVLDYLKTTNYKAYKIGTVVKGKGQVVVKW